MSKYLLKRILFSIFSLIVVIAIVMLLVYTCIKRNVIFNADDVWNKKSENDQKMYEYTMWQKYGYLDFIDYSSFLKDKYYAIYGEGYANEADFKADRDVIQHPDKMEDNASYREFKEKYSNRDIVYLNPVRYSNGQFKPGGKAVLLAVREKSVFLRLWDYFAGLITFEHKNQVKDEALTDRYVRFEKDPYSGMFAIVGSGTNHKYQLYFNNRFPFIHQNWMHFNFGTSYTTYRGQEITTVITTPTGDLKETRQQYPSALGTDQYVNTAIDFHSVTYNSSGQISDADKEIFTDNYTVYSYQKSGLSPLENSFLIGIVSVILSYGLGVSIGIAMSRKKDGLLDKIGNAYIVFVAAVPSLAYIFLVAAIGTRVFKLPYKFASAEVKILAYILPTISLSLGSIGSLMKWTRRYMIDQMNSDYVKFARAEGMSEKEIYNIHISRNALIYLVQGIPSSILFCLTGALMTERVYSVPGVGGILINAINLHDNAVIVAMTGLITAISIIGLILGDLLLAAYDPRISLSTDSGGGRK